MVCANCDFEYEKAALEANGDISKHQALALGTTNLQKYAYSIPKRELALM
jgi:hypothetical protein